MCFRVNVLGLFLACFVFFTACNNGTKNAETEGESLSLSEDFNNQALQLLSKAKDTSDLIQAMYILEKAITVDTSNYVAYNNLMGVLLQLKKYEKAYQVIEVLATQTNVPNYTLFKGFLEEKYLNDTVASHASYMKSIIQIDSLMQNGVPQGDLQLNKLLATFMAYGKEPALKLYDSMTLGMQDKSVYQDLYNAIITDNRHNILEQAMP